MVGPVVIFGSGQMSMLWGSITVRRPNGKGERCSELGSLSIELGTFNT